MLPLYPTESPGTRAAGLKPMAADDGAGGDHQADHLQLQAAYTTHTQQHLHSISFGSALAATVRANFATFTFPFSASYEEVRSSLSIYHQNSQYKESRSAALKIHQILWRVEFRILNL